MTLPAIRARLAAATPGPWRSRPHQQPEYRYVAFSTKRDEWYTTSPLEPADADFIAHAPADIAALLAVAEAAETLLDAWDRLANADDGQEPDPDDAYQDAMAALRAALEGVA
jgi:hypothetical protein